MTEEMKHELLRGAFEDVARIEARIDAHESGLHRMSMKALAYWQGQLKQQNERIERIESDTDDHWH